MITYVNKSNTRDYTDLYAKVTELLMTHDKDDVKKVVEVGDSNALMPLDPVDLTEDSYMTERYYWLNPETEKYELCTDANFDAEKDYFKCDSITSLEELFSWMAQIAEIAPKYTRLPLDEAVFEIDANTRVITVPDDFKKNGISVQGDEISEIVYFKINRFYDTIDLMTRNIFIEWEAPSKETGVSMPYIIDAESVPGSIIFGWPLSSKITKMPGTVTFGVRFYTYDTDARKIVYSLSTLKQTAVIKPAMAYDLGTIIREAVAVDDASEMVKNRIINSTLYDGSSKAAEPEFIITLPSHINLTLVDGFYNGDTNAIVQAMTPDAGQLTYQWKKYELKEAIDPVTGEHEIGDLQDIEYKIDFVETKDTVKKTGKLYYTKTGANYVVLDALATIEEMTDQNIVVYEKISTAVIDSVGYYCVIARNRVRNSTAETRDPVKGFCIVAWPDKPVLAEGKELPEKGILDDEEGVTLTANAEAVSQAKITLNGKETGEEVKGVLTYQWQKASVSDPENFHDIDGATNQKLTIVPEVDEEGNPVYDANGVLLGDGYYRVVTTNNLNKQKASITSEVATRVTHGPSAPVITVVDNNIDLVINTEDNTAKIEASIDPAAHESRTEEDTITYQWYRYHVGSGSDLDTDKEKASRGEYVIQGDDLIQDATDDYYRPSAAGYWYYCWVTNTYNGQKKSKCSPFFSVVDR